MYDGNNISEAFVEAQMELALEVFQLPPLIY